MKKDTITEEKAKKTPAGGVLVGKREGQTIIHDKGTQGGYFVGKLHKEGGIKGINKSTGQPIEVQGGEVIITAPAVADQTKREFEGEMLTNREILSKINEKGGGVSLENGGEIYFNGSSYNYGGKTMTDYEIMQEISNCGCEHEYNDGGFIGGYEVDYFETKRGVYANIEIPSSNPTFEDDIQIKGFGKTEKEAFEDLKKEFEIYLKKSKYEYGGKIKTYKNKYNKKYGYPANESHDLEEISKDTGVSLKGLQQIYNKGIGAYKTNPESVRPNVKSKEQWAMARVYSAVMGGKASKIDANELKMNYGGGLSKAKSLQDIADMHNVSLQSIKKELAKGIEVESEHTSDKKLAEKIAKDHLAENPKYYTILDKVGLKNGGQLDLVKESKKGDHPSRDLNNYNDLMDVEADGMVGAETGLSFADGGNLDFLDDAVSYFTNGGSTAEVVEYIEIWSAGSSLSKLYGTKYDDYKDLKKALAEINPQYSYIYLAPNGKSMGGAIDVKKDGRNTVKTINPNTATAKDFEKVIKRSWGEWRFEKYDLSNWLKDNGKRTPKPQPQPEPKKEIANKIFFDVYLGNNIVKSDNNHYIFGFKKSLDNAFNEFGNKGNVRVKIFLTNNDGKNVLATENIYLDNSNYDIFNFNVLSFNDSDFERLFANIFPLENLDGVSEFEPPLPFSSQELEMIFKGKKPEPQPEPIKEEVKIDFEATRKYLTLRIADLTKELNFKKPRLSNEEIGFYQRDINELIFKLRKINEKELDFFPIKERLQSAYSLKWGDINAEYKPSEDLLASNGLPTKLTDEEWVNVRTDYFSSFFGDWRLANEIGDFSGVSKVIDPETKEPMPVYHGTNVLFTEWKTYKTNNAHYFAKNRDFSQWFAEQWSKGRGDISAKDSNLLKQLNPNKGEYLYRCFLDIKNPIDFSRFGVEKRPVSDFLMFLQINYNIGDFDFWTNFRLFNNLAQDTLVYSWMIIRNWQSFTEYIKMATTYDGYIFYEYHPEKVGTGLDGASLSFCAFDSSQIKFTNATEFNALITDSRFEKGGKL